MNRSRFVGHSPLVAFSDFTLTLSGTHVSAPGGALTGHIGSKNAQGIAYYFAGRKGDAGKSRPGA